MRRSSTDRPDRYTKDRGPRKRATNLWHRYRVTPEEFDAQFAEQRGLCGICGDPFTSHDGKDGPCIDHDHVTGHLRGLLCKPCNTMIGGARDRPEVLQAAVNYLGDSDHQHTEPQPAPQPECREESPPSASVASRFDTLPRC